MVSAGTGALSSESCECPRCGAGSRSWGQRTWFCPGCHVLQAPAAEPAEQVFLPAQGPSTRPRRVKKLVHPEFKASDSRSRSPSGCLVAPPSPRPGSSGSHSQKFGQAAPGSQQESGVDEVITFQRATGGFEQESANTLAPLMLTYCRSVWPGAHLASQQGARTKADLVMLATVIDYPLSGNLAAAGSIFMHRFRPGHLASCRGWHVAGQLNLVSRADASMVPMEMEELARQDQQRCTQFSEGLRRSGVSSVGRVRYRESPPTSVRGREDSDDARRSPGRCAARKRTRAHRRASRNRRSRETESAGPLPPAQPRERRLDSSARLEEAMFPQDGSPSLRPPGVSSVATLTEDTLPDATGCGSSQPGGAAFCGRRGRQASFEVRSRPQTILTLAPERPVHDHRHYPFSRSEMASFDPAQQRKTQARWREQRRRSESPAWDVPRAVESPTRGRAFSHPLPPSTASLPPREWIGGPWGDGRRNGKGLSLANTGITRPPKRQRRRCGEGCRCIGGCSSSFCCGGTRSCCRGESVHGERHYCAQCMYGMPEREPLG